MGYNASKAFYRLRSKDNEFWGVLSVLAVGGGTVCLEKTWHILYTMAYIDTILLFGTAAKICGVMLLGGQNV